MTNITAIHPWTVHLCKADDEWEAQCGASEPPMLMEPNTKLLPGYKVCPLCLESQPVVDKTSEPT